MKDHNDKYVLAAATLATLALVSGCRTVGSAGASANTFMGHGEEVEEVVGDPSLARELQMERILTERRDDRLHVQFDLRNTRRSNLPIEWTMVWLDARGFQIETPRAWTPLVLGGNSFESIARTAPTPEARAFRMAFRRPSTVH